MQLPVDPQKLLKEAADIDAARETPLSLSVYIDASAPADLVAHVRTAFASDRPTVRLTLAYFTDQPMSAHPTDDLAIIVAGSSEATGPSALAVRNAGVPVMVCATQPALVELLAAAAGAPIPQGDLLAPQKAKRTWKGDAIAFAKRVAKRDLGYNDDQTDGFKRASDIDIDAAMEAPIELDEPAKALLNERMGLWIASVCRSKRLAFALAFPFMRRSLAMESVSETSIQNAGVGLIPLIPGADLPIMTINQAKMVLQIAASYGQPMGKERAKEIIAVVGGAFACRAIARELIELVPVLGGVVRTGVGYFGTEAMGRAVIEYFEGGENVGGVAHVVERATSAASETVAQLRNMVASARTAADASAVESE